MPDAPEAGDDDHAKVRIELHRDDAQREAGVLPPPSIITARRSRTLTPIATLVSQPNSKPLALCRITMASIGNRPSVSSCRSFTSPSTMKASSAASEKFASGF